jgi:hypothetical protein
LSKSAIVLPLWRTAAILVSASLFTNIAGAQTKTTEAPVVVAVAGSRPGLAMVLEHDDNVIASCSTPCTVTVPPGTYWLQLSGDDEQLRVLTKVSRNEQLTVMPPNSTVKWAGLGLGITGAAAGTVGVALLFSLAWGRLGPACDDCDQRGSWIVPTTITTLAFGAVATSIGWTMFGRNRKPSVERTPLAASGPTASIPMVHVIPVTGGAALLTSVAF